MLKRFSPRHHSISLQYLSALTLQQRQPQSAVNYKNFLYHPPSISPIQQSFVFKIQHNGLSTQAQATSTNKKKNDAISLRRLTTPFLQLCHPDKLAHIGSEEVRSVNLKAIQTLNGLLDSIEQAYNSGVVTSSDIQPEYCIEFIVPNTLDEGASMKKNKSAASTTRCEVILTFPSFTCSDKHTLRRRAVLQIKKLLRAAALSIPRNIATEEDKEDDTGEDLLMDEFDINNNSTSNNDKSKSNYEKSRDKFVRSIDWIEMKQRYDNAVKAYHADIVTSGVTSTQLKQQMIANILSRIRIQPSESNNLLDQIITMRRISLLLSDHYLPLQMEDNGRFYENIIFVLVPIDNTATRKLRKRSGESGFKFSVGKEKDVISVYIPMDFDDEELIMELKEHLPNFMYSEIGGDEYIPLFR